LYRRLDADEQVELRASGSASVGKLPMIDKGGNRIVHML
jgi:hypothetical protein